MFWSSEFLISDWDELDDACKKVVRGYAKRLDLQLDGQISRGEVRTWLVEKCYRLIGETMIDGFLYEVLVERIGFYGRKRRGVEGDPTDFQTGILGLFAHTEEPALSSAERRRLGRQLQYAWRHLIPPDFVRAFLLDVTVARAEENAGTTYIEPRYTGWIIRCLSDEETYEVRASEFPKAVREKARAAIKTREDSTDEWIESD